MLEFIIRLPTIKVASVHSERVTFMLDDYSAHLQPEVEDALCQSEYFLIQIGCGVAGDVLVNDTTSQE